MAAKWSDLWKEKTNEFARKIALYNARFIPQAPAKPKTGGKFPHLQPFNIGKKGK